MKFWACFLLLIVSFQLATAGSIDCTKVAPITQPSPSTTAEKVGVKFKPQLTIRDGCVSFPAVNAAGETNAGLKEGDSGGIGCSSAPLGSQVYGRSAWYNGKYAILYAWYFPKGFWANVATRRHDWASAVVWIDRPDAASPSILGLSISTADWVYKTQAPASSGITGGTTARLSHGLQAEKGPAYLTTTDSTGSPQDLIMWEQLSSAARTALSTTDFGNAKVPMSDANFQTKLKKAWPF
uniref:Necrosis inducing-like protein NPP1 type n=1 Tax=Phytophthora ramorum TaxID=164328 RepID=H3GB28_PHYRM